MRFLLLVISVCFAMTSLTACGGNKNKNQSNIQEDALIQTSRVSFLNLVQQYQAFGTVYASKKADIVSYTKGVISDIWIKNGQKVEKGENLLSVEGFYKIKDRQTVQLDDPNNKDGIIKRSPMNGYISSLNKYPGNKVDEGETLVSVIELRNLFVKTEVFDESASMKVGQKVQVISEGKTLDGVVASVAFDINPDTGGKTVEIRVTQQEPAKIFPGESVKVLFISEHNNVLSVPKSALLNENGNEIVFLKTRNGYEKMNITTGISSKEYVEVLSGLKKNDIIVTTGAYELLNQDIHKKITIED